MNQFAIMELADGLTVVALGAEEQAEEAAAREGGVLVDAGPYATYEEACDALLLMDTNEDDPDEPASAP